jgi:hypothetical protein
LAILPLLLMFVWYGMLCRECSNNTTQHSTTNNTFHPD